MSPSPAEESRLFIGSLARGLEVLAVFWEGKPSMKLAELAQTAGITKSAAQRFTHTLVTLGYLRKSETTREYSLAPKALEIGLRYLQTNVLVAGATPYVHSLNRACQETCSVAEPDGSDMIYVARFPALKEMYINMPLGKRIPMYCTASGRAYLSRLPPDEALALLASSKRTAYTANTITDLTRLQALLDEARDQGFAWAESEYYSADINISAPILGPHGLPVGAVNISAAGSRFTLEQARRELGPQVVETARTISSSNLLRRAAPR